MTNELDELVLAECKCGTKRNISFRTLKNKWPHCKVCSQPMIIKPNKPLVKEDKNADTTNSATN